MNNDKQYPMCIAIVFYYGSPSDIRLRAWIVFVQVGPREEGLVIDGEGRADGPAISGAEGRADGPGI